jgi:RNA polymerase sigma-70 factor (ECF subfamily)
MGGSHDIADDLTQEAFVRAYEAIESFDEDYPFYSWISRIATNNAINFIRRQKRQVGGEESEVVLGMQHTTDIASNPELTLSQKEIDKRYQEAVGNLTEEFRVVFVLRMQEELSYEEIAARLKINPGTVMSRLHRARQKLMEELKDILEQ